MRSPPSYSQNRNRLWEQPHSLSVFSWLRKSSYHRSHHQLEVTVKLLVNNGLWYRALRSHPPSAESASLLEKKTRRDTALPSAPSTRETVSSTGINEDVRIPPRMRGKSPGWGGWDALGAPRSKAHGGGRGLQLTWGSGVSLAATTVCLGQHPPRVSPGTSSAGKERGPG